jgi:hypothetical protein
MATSIRWGSRRAIMLAAAVAVGTSIIAGTAAVRAWISRPPSVQAAELVTALRQIGPFADIKQEGPCWRQLPFEHGYPTRTRCSYLAGSTDILIGFRPNNGDVLFVRVSRKVTDEQAAALSATLSELMDVIALHHLLCPDAAPGRAEAVVASLPVQAAATRWHRFDSGKLTAAERNTHGASRRIEFERTDTCRLRLEELNDQGSFKLTLLYRKTRRL